MPLSCRLALIGVLLACPAAGQIADADRLLTTGADLVAKGDYTGALALLDPMDTAALSDAQRARRQIARAGALLELGRHHEAVAAIDDGDQAARRIDDAELLARLESSRGVAWRMRGRLLRAIEHFERALSLAERSGSGAVLSQIYLQTSTAYQQMGDWPRMLDYAERSFRATPHPTDRQREAYLANRGIALYEFHDRDGAHASFTEALALARKRGDKRAESFMLGELALLSWEFDRDRDRALEYSRQAYALAKEVEVPSLQTVWLLNWGNVYRDTGELDEALTFYRRALDVHRSIRGSQGHATAVKNIGQVLVMKGDRHDEADRLLRQAVEIADATGNQNIRWQARMELAKLHGERDPALAERYHRETLDLLEGGHASVLLENFRAGQFSRQLARYDPYERYIDFLLARGDTRQAFSVAERARARVFLDTLAAAREQLARSVSPEFADAENALLRQISTYQATLRDTTLPSDRRETTAAAVRDLEDQLAALRARLGSDNPALANARFPRIWTAGDLQREVLQGDEALLMFFVGKERSVAWLVQKDGFDVARLPGRPAIEAAVRPYLDAVRAPGPARHREASRAVFRLLLGDLAPKLREGARLVIVPHGLLHYIPFEALTDPTDRYLLQRAIVSYAPSASSYAFLRRLPPPASRGNRLLAIGNPNLGGGAAGADRGGVPIEHAGLLPPLPHTARELRSLSDSLRDVEVLEGERATETALAAAGLDPLAALHFATHAIVDEERPDRSGLALTLQAPASDGLLQVREVYRLKLPSVLVTLSACQTALGRNLTGEGMVGLARAFFYAGANAVTASLWNVSDASTADLMAAFYEALGQGEAVDSALRSAKLALLARGGERAHPFYWAAFVAMGDGGMRVPLEPAQPLSPAAAGGILVFSALVIVLALRRRQPRLPSPKSQLPT